MVVVGGWKRGWKGEEKKKNLRTPDVHRLGPNIGGMRFCRAQEAGLTEGTSAAYQTERERGGGEERGGGGERQRKRRRRERRLARLLHRETMVVG